jgi:hypothetical protein
MANTASVKNPIRSAVCPGLADRPAGLSGITCSPVGLVKIPADNNQDRRQASDFPIDSPRAEHR